MSDLAFIDTNVLVYAYDSRDPVKRDIARSLIRKLLAGKGAISTQVVQEFCSVALHPKKPLTGDDIELVFEEVLLVLLQHVPSADFYRRALKLCRYEQLSFYDALIVQAAIDLGCQTLYSEDLQAGRVYGSLSVKNPFK